MAVGILVLIAAYQGTLNFLYTVIPAYVPNLYHFIAVSIGLSTHPWLTFPLVCNTILLLLFFTLAARSPWRESYTCAENVPQQVLDYIVVSSIAVLALYHAWFHFGKDQSPRPAVSLLGGPALACISMDLLLNVLGTLQHHPSIRLVDSPHMLLFVTLIVYVFVYGKNGADGLDDGKPLGYEQRQWDSAFVFLLLIFLILGIVSSGREWIQEIMWGHWFNSDVTYTRLFYGCVTTLTSDEWTSSLRDPFVWYAFSTQINDMVLMLTSLVISIQLAYDFIATCQQR